MQHQLNFVNIMKVNCFRKRTADVFHFTMMRKNKGRLTINIHPIEIVSIS
jgi:hypothetical protein